MILLNPIPTTGEMRDSWKRGMHTVEPAVSLLRAGMYQSLGWGVTRAARDLLAVPSISRVTDRAQQTGGVLASRAGRIVDDAHDSIEEAYGRGYLGVNWLRTSVPERFGSR